jgi:hypothetical protein
MNPAPRMIYAGLRMAQPPPVRLDKSLRPHAPQNP